MRLGIMEMTSVRGYKMRKYQELSPILAIKLILLTCHCMPYSWADLMLLLIDYDETL